MRSSGSDTNSTLRWRPGIHHWSWSSIQLESLHRGTTMQTSFDPSTIASVSSNVEASRLSLPRPMNRPFNQTQAIESAEPTRRNVRRPDHDASRSNVRRYRPVGFSAGMSGAWSRHGIRMLR